ncbi:MAG: tRNA uridine-5-carboxymethylaminomethyl(34) synthesis GTPase MnmE [Pseudomonadota bacterium]|nr:tRNA uridine-5-carboxymethylaminomethyl(34) synthesis GTPase MnmE [Pseudomonadota bacterium]
MLLRHHDPVVAVATASGRGAVGIVRVSGTGLAGFAQALLGRPLEPRHASFLPFRDARGDVIDQGLALFFPGPHSYTGEDVLELQAHGGPVVLQLLVARCLEVATDHLAGLRLAQPGEFTERAFLNDKLDLAQAEAVGDLIEASTEAAARSASRSLTGAFSSQINALRDSLIELRMLVEATLDFPEEDIDFLEQANARGRLVAIAGQIDAVLDRARQGALLRDGIQVVLAGQPNVGKSSLLNVLAGAELAIVTPIAGTTRDKVSGSIQIEGVPIHVIDTAGLRDSADEVERIGVARSWTEIERADVVLFLHDLTRLGDPDYAAAEARIESRLPAGLAHGERLLHVYNKADRVEQTPEGLAVSALTGAGIEALRGRLLKLAGWQGQTEGLFIARTRHVEALRATRAHLAIALDQVARTDAALDLLAEELRLAHDALGAITGAFGAEALLGEIFGRFCIGK